MDSNMQNRIFDLLKSTFDYNGTIHFLAVSVKESSRDAQTDTTFFKVRVALTLQENDALCPYFDGTELSIEVTPSDISFAYEEEWADGPPVMEGSPNALALPWVSELAPPFFVSNEAREASSKTTDLLKDAHIEVEIEGR